MGKKLYKKLNKNKSICLICSHFCHLKNNWVGLCGVRKNVNGEIVSLAKNTLSARGVDPIEKKPLFHVLPSSLSYSIAGPGCNFSCLFCQNASLAQTPALCSKIEGVKIDPLDIVEDAKNNNCKSISYTYSEPTVFFELMKDTAILAKEENLLNIMVSNGFMSLFVLNELSDLIDSANIDLKSFNKDFYQKICGGKLKPVLKNLIEMKKRGIFVEVTTLLITGLNDSKEEIDQIAAFIKNELGEDTPWHISRFYPTFKMKDQTATKTSSIHRAIEAGDKKGLKYIYSGNMPGDLKESTYCPSCKKILIERKGFCVIENRMENGKCPYCEESINGIF